MSRATLTAQEFADKLGVSQWALYESVRRGDCPIPPIQVGRRLVWPRVVVDRLLGLEHSEGRPTTADPSQTITSTTTADGHGQRT